MFSMFLLSKRSTCGSLCTLEKGVNYTAEILVCMYMYNLNLQASILCLQNNYGTTNKTCGTCRF